MLENRRTQLKHCVDEIIYIIKDKKAAINNRQLINICKDFTEIFRIDIDPHIYHEIGETSLNFLIKQKYAEELLTSSDPIKELTLQLKPLVGRLPTQTWRSNEQIKQQQFSTPPQIGYLLSFLLNFQKKEFVLEPSAGTGCLAVWASGFGLQTFTNEIDARRRELLSFLGFTSSHFNAEYINDFLTKEVKPNVLIMNPPFTSNGGRTKNSSSKFGFRHVKSALERLQPGGKFGIILGNSAGLDTKTGRKFWNEMSSKVSVKAIIKINGREYRKYGTNVDVNLVIGTKYLKPQEKGNRTIKKAITNISVSSIEEGFDIAKKTDIRLN